jgi:hypothetical protein
MPPPLSGPGSQPGNSAIPRPAPGMECPETDATHFAGARTWGSEAYPAFIAVGIGIFHVPGRGPSDVFTKVSGNHRECHIDAR